MINGSYVADFMAKRLADDDLPLVEAPKTELPRARYRFADGTTVTIRGISLMLILGAQSETGRPEPPARSVKMAGGGMQHIPRRDDEKVLSEAELAAIQDPEKRKTEEAYARYRRELSHWENERNTRMARLLFLTGVEDSPPPEIAGLWKQLGFHGEMDIKYAWLASKLPDGDAMQHFFDTVTSLTTATEEGLERAEAMFQGGVSGSGVVGTPDQAQPATGEARPEEAQGPSPAGYPDIAPSG